MNTMQELLDEMKDFVPSAQLIALNERYLQLWKARRQADDAWHIVAAERRTMINKEIVEQTKAKMKAEILAEMEAKKA